MSFSCSVRPWEGQCLRALGAGVRVRGREREQEPASRWGEACKGKWGLAQAGGCLVSTHQQCRLGPC